MSVRKEVGKRQQLSPAGTILTFALTILAAPALVLLAIYAYTLILGGTGVSVAAGYAIIVAIFTALGFVIFKR